MVLPQQQQEIQEEFMEISEESQDGQALMLDSMANGRSTNGCSTSTLLVGTPPTSTTIIDEPVPEICGFLNLKHFFYFV